MNKAKSLIVAIALCFAVTSCGTDRIEPIGDNIGDSHLIADLQWGFDEFEDSTGAYFCEVISQGMGDPDSFMDEILAGGQITTLAGNVYENTQTNRDVVFGFWVEQCGL